KKRKKGKIASSTRKNVQIVLRSVLKFAKEKAFIAAIPAGLPRLKKPEQMSLEIPSDDEVSAIFTKAAPTHRIASGLMAYAGLRPNEVRALLRRDVQLRRDGDGVVLGGFLSVR